MKIEHYKILGERIFQEVTIPCKVFKLKNDVLGIYHSYYGQWSGRHQTISKKSITLFDSTGQKTIGHLENIGYPLNDLDYDPDKQEVVLATGSYDGGAMFEGELLLWNIKENNTNKILTDNREFTNCEFIKDSIKINVNPTDDLWTEKLTVKSYDIKRGVLLQELNEFQSNKEVEFKWENDSINKQEDFIGLAKAIDNNFEYNAITWDIQIIENEIISAHSNGKLAIHSIDKKKAKSIQIRDKGDCVQLFYNSNNNRIIVNTCFRGVDEEDKSIAYEVDLISYTKKEKIKGCFSLSKTKENYFLARQTNHTYGKEKDRIFNSELQLVKELNIGHYDLFNHYLRIDNETEHYALVGNPKNQHKLKEINRIDPVTFIQSKVFTVDDIELHLMEPNFLKVKCGIIVQGKIYNPNPETGNHKMSAYSDSGQLKWTKATNDNAIDLKNIDDNYFLVISNNGRIEILDSSGGETTKDLSNFSKVNNCRPLCASCKDGLIAIGYDNGLIELFKIKE